MIVAMTLLAFAVAVAMLVTLAGCKPPAECCGCGTLLLVNSPLTCELPAPAVRKP
jgi:hypothetical protein